jgi:hypothetical protein
MIFFFLGLYSLAYFFTIRRETKNSTFKTIFSADQQSITLPSSLAESAWFLKFIKL